MINHDEIVAHLKKLRKNCYAPGSNFHVAAIIRNEDGEWFDGVNVENASYGLTICAERSAVFTMVSQVGYKKIDDVWIMAGLKDDNSSASHSYPCGACRQVLAEFGHAHTMIHLIGLDGEQKIGVLLSSLIPDSFGFSDFQ